jgi:3',5'-cyclic AMP phosphodiesterase CpdA
MGKCSDDFYFIQITDTHVMHKLFDMEEEYKTNFARLIDYISLLENKPEFVVITGDLVSSGGGIIGALHYKAFLECVHKKDGQLYTDTSCDIPVYTIPGNHDYMLNMNLLNYHIFIDNKHVVWSNLLDLLEKRQINDRYTVTHENLTLFFLDSGHNYYLNPMNLLDFKGSGLSYWFDIEWLETSLNNCESKHKIVLMHHPAINWGEKDVIARNRESFIQLCEGYNIDLVLAGHTHAARVFDKDKNFYPNNVLPLNCSSYPTLYVQTDACKEGSFYRTITISGNDIFLNPCENL